MAGGRATTHGRAVVLHVLLVATALGVVALTASWAPRWGVDVLAGTRVVVVPTAEESSADALDATAEVLETRARDAGAPGATARRRSDGALLVTLPGRPDDRVLDALRSTGQVGLRAVVARGDDAPTGTGTATGSADGGVDAAGLPTTGDSAVAWTRSPDPTWAAALPSYRCGDDTGPVAADQPLLACDAAGGTYLLGPALAAGDTVDGAAAELREAPAGEPGGAEAPGGAEGEVPDGPAPDDAPADRVPGDDVPADPADPADPAAPGDPGAEFGDDPADGNFVPGGEEPVLDGGRWGVRVELDPGAADGVATLVALTVPPDAPDAPDAPDGPDGPQADVPQVALTIDGDVVAVSDLTEPDDGAVLVGRLDQPEAEAAAERVRAGALPVAVDHVDVIRLGSTLDRDEGAHGALGAGVGLLVAALAVGALARRRAVLPLVATAGTAALVAPLLLLADQVVGLPLTLPVAVAVAGTLPVVPLLAAGVQVAGEREAPGRTPAAAAERGGAEAWRRWWPCVAAGVVGAGAVRLVAGGELGDVAVAVGVVLAAALVSGLLLVRPLAVVLAERRGAAHLPGATTPATTPATSRFPRPASARRVVAGLLVAAAVVAAAGLALRGVASDPAFTTGEEHLVAVVGDPVDARSAVRDAARGSGVPVSSVRTAGDGAVLVTTPRLTTAERTALTADLAALPVTEDAGVSSAGFRAAGSPLAWVGAGALVLVALLAGLALTRGLLAWSLRAVGVVVAATALALLTGTGLAAWAGVTASPATLAALLAVAVTAVVAHVAVVAGREVDDWWRRYVEAAALALLPLLGVVLAAPSVRGPFLVVAGGLLVATTTALLLAPTRLMAPPPLPSGVGPAPGTAGTAGAGPRRTVSTP
ncbi:hypothetical protein INN71_10205 [Nocardioides sp. ChNu-153]|uniref:hypothetical protein n=1 Tax=Nocardioides sp. ChNu-153 TaxID=2779364 RepID=UPI00264F6CAA|nr:hypothetical protein [Nocardioides sp. ChNu-153]MDN7121759.1 hypothetical protein [Nocardioides sp. ChNu-153]